MRKLILLFIIFLFYAPMYSQDSIYTKQDTLKGFKYTKNIYVLKAKNREMIVKKPLSEIEARNLLEELPTGFYILNKWDGKNTSECVVFVKDKFKNKVL